MSTSNRILEISFGRSELLWLLPILVAALALRLWWARRLRRRQAGIGATAPALVASRDPRLAALRGWCLWLGLGCAVIAAAQPRWGSQQVSRIGRGANIVLLLDCSRSMLAEDLYPSRIEAARRKALDLLHAAPEHRMALMPFAAIAVLRCPLSGDRIALETMLQDCDPALFPVERQLQGTAIGAAVDDAIDILATRGDRGRAILICSDGSDPDEDAVAAAAERARSAGIPVYGMFLGDPELEATLVIDGEERAVPADRSSLDLLAERSGAICVNATTDDADIRALTAHIRDSVSLLPWEERTRIMASERYLLALLPAIVLLALGALVPTRRARRREDDA